MDAPELAVKVTDLPTTAGDSMSQVHSCANLCCTCHTFSTLTVVQVHHDIMHCLCYLEAITDAGAYALLQFTAGYGMYAF